MLNNLTEQTSQTMERLASMHKDQKMIELEDNFNCVKILAEVNQTIPEMKKTINDMFIEGLSSGITLMTVHKSKGLQAPKIIILRPDQLPMKETPEEMRVKYVALTRAQEELYFVEPPPKR
jgi:ATP-dependent exoDNAse (exonuclease V) beta subunit